MARTVGYAKCQQRDVQIKKPPPMARKETDAIQNVCPMASAPKFAPVESSGVGSADGTVTTRYVARGNRARASRFVAQFWGLDSRESGRRRG